MADQLRNVVVFHSQIESNVKPETGLHGTVIVNWRRLILVNCYIITYANNILSLCCIFIILLQLFSASCQLTIKRICCAILCYALLCWKPNQLSIKAQKNGGSSPDLVAVWLFQLHSVTSLHVLTIFCLCVLYCIILQLHSASCQLTNTHPFNGPFSGTT